MAGQSLGIRFLAYKMVEIKEMSEEVNRIHGCLAGGAIGDSLGLPYEGMSRTRAQRLLGSPNANRLLFGYGMVSDDTEHACMTAIALIRSEGELNKFELELASQLRKWFLCLPPAIGLATAKACIKLLIGFKPELAGAKSAGNGPAMRSAIIGCSVKNIRTLKSLIKISSRITHADVRSFEGAFLIALGTNWAQYNSTKNPLDFFNFVEKSGGIPSDPEFQSKFQGLRDSILASEETSSFAAGIGMQKGISGFIIPTTLVALHAWLTNFEEFDKTITKCILCGGDTDTVAAIGGSLSGTYLGFNSIPKRLGKTIIDYPFAYNRLSKLARLLANKEVGNSYPKWIGLRWLILPFRNIALVIIILMHVLRRAAPPY